jgi:hypothetical protein
LAFDATNSACFNEFCKFLYQLAFANRSAISPWQPVDNFASQTPLHIRQETRSTAIDPPPEAETNAHGKQPTKAKGRETSSLSLTTRFGKSKIKSKSVF